MGKANTATFEPWKYFIAKEGKIVAEVHEVDGDAGEPCSAHAGGSVFTSDVARAQRVASRVETGTMFINNIAWSDAELPFGGMKDSGS